jgi:TetR/AcrR family transcriptional regulator, cholesterol catabolism regulator
MAESEVLDRRQLILERAAELFARKGVAPTTVREIGDAVGILSGSLYHHFDSKDAIAGEIVAGYVDDLLTRYRRVRATLADDPSRCLAGLLAASFQSLDAHRNACAIYRNDLPYLSALPGFGVTRRRCRLVQEIWIEVLRDGIARGVFRSDIDPWFLDHLVRDAVEGAARWYGQQRRYDAEAIADAYTGILLGGYLAA